jgi:hypothetical protein
MLIMAIFIFGYGITLESKLKYSKKYDKDFRVKLELKRILNRAEIRDLEE